MHDLSGIATVCLQQERLVVSAATAADRIIAGERDFAGIEDHVARELTDHSWIVDYVSVRNRATLLAPGTDDERFIILVAARLGITRLIDNIEC